MRIPFLRPRAPTAASRARPAAAKAGTARAEPREEDPASVEAARTRARRRLVGALVLLTIGVVGFPVLFETQPRPLPVDTRIEIASHEAASLPPAASAALRARPVPVVPADLGGEVIEPAPAAAAPPLPAAVIASSPRASPAAPARQASVATPVRTPTLAEAPAVAAAPAAAPPRPASGASARFVVQAGAYSDAGTLREARAKVEKAGLKTYTQVIETDAGKRTRVRVGPFASRQEAEAAAAKIKRAGLPANVITL
jgi:DedD protein